MKNIGSTDKVIRIIMGLILLSLLFILNGNIRYLGLLGLVPVVTAIAGHCPLYRLLGIRSNKKAR